MSNTLSAFEGFIHRAGNVVRVELARVRGSGPREAGASMFVSAMGHTGTIGGGQLEYMAIDQARVLLKSGGSTAHMDVPLGPEIGQCCGGRVEVDLSRLDARGKDAAIAEHAAKLQAYPAVLIVGAGHVGRALASIMALLPVRPVLVDSREEELALCEAPIERRLTPLPEAEVRKAEPGGAVVTMTHEHSLDFMVAAEALARPDLRYVGMIGSKSKRASFVNWCKANIDPPVDTDALVCPMGAQGSSDKRPEVIAAFVAAEVIARLTENDGTDLAFANEGGFVR